MKTLLVRSILGGLLLSSPLWWAGSAAAETHNINGQVTAVQGSATLSVPGQPETPLKPGADVPPGAVIHTSPGGSVDVFLGRNTGVIRVAENSALKVRALQVTDTGSETVTDTQLELQKGELFGNVNKQSAASTYEITLPDGAVDMRQSRFQIVSRAPESPGGKAGQLADNNQPLRSTVRVLMGQASFTHDGQLVVLGNHQELNPETGKPAPMTAAMVAIIGQAFLTMDLAPQTASGGADGNNKSKSDGGNVIQVSARALTSLPPQETPLSPTTGGR